jgi:hypothetical protein
MSYAWNVLHFVYLILHDTLILSKWLKIHYIKNVLYRSVKKKLRGFGPLANYADQATTACWQYEILRYKNVLYKKC